jgi:hypothetical protein
MGHALPGESCDSPENKHTPRAQARENHPSHPRLTVRFIPFLRRFFPQNPVVIPDFSFIFHEYQVTSPQNCTHPSKRLCSKTPNGFPSSEAPVRDESSATTSDSPFVEK